MKALIASLEAKHPTVRASMLAALGNVVPSHLMDRRITRATPASKHQADHRPEGEAESSAGVALGPPSDPQVDPNAGPSPVLAISTLLRHLQQRS